MAHRERSMTLALTFALLLLADRLGGGIPGGAELTAVPNANPPAKRVPANKLSKPGLKNFFQVTTNLYRCAQPTARGMRELEAMGIKTVINLRAFNTDKDEAKGTSLKREHISFNTWHPEDEDVIRFLKIVTDTNRGPVVVHCQHGSDRTGMMIAVYRIAVEGWSKDEAIKEMTTGGFGFHRLWKNLIRYLRALNVEGLMRRAGIEFRPVSN